MKTSKCQPCYRNLARNKLQSRDSKRNQGNALCVHLTRRSCRSLGLPSQWTTVGLSRHGKAESPPMQSKDVAHFLTPERRCHIANTYVHQHGPLRFPQASRHTRCCCTNPITGLNFESSLCTSLHYHPCLASNAMENDKIRMSLLCLLRRQKRMGSM